MATIYDVGMHNGDDIDYYLKKGHKVVGIDANSALCLQVRERFADRLDRDLVVLNVGIAQTLGELDFYVNTVNSVLSTFDPSGAGRPEGEWQKVRVPTTTLAEIVRTHGDPYFIKIDIEHFDVIALDDLRRARIRPPFISAEAHTFDVFVALLRLGYRRFMMVNCAAISRVFARHPIRLQDGTTAVHAFPHHSSGPFGDDLPGPWLTAEQLAYLFFGRNLLLGEGWFDIHGRR